MSIQFILQITTMISGGLLIALILLNQPQNDSTFGSSNSFQITRRGAEKQLHNAIVVLSIIFVTVILLTKII